MISFSASKKRRRAAGSRSQTSTANRSPYLRIDHRRLLGWLTVFITLGLIYYAFSSRYFTINSHTCTYLDGRDCPQVIQIELTHQHGQNSLTFSPDDLSRKLAFVEPLASRVDVAVDLPGHLTVTFIPQTVLANVKIATDSASLLVSDHHQVIGQSNAPDPQAWQIIDPSAIRLRMGDRIIDTPLAYTLDLVQALQAGFIQPQRIIVYSDKLIVAELEEDRRAIFTTHSPITRQVTSLQLILAKATITHNMPVIDVRYHNPVLRPQR